MYSVESGLGLFTPIQKALMPPKVPKKKKKEKKNCRPSPYPMGPPMSRKKRPRESGTSASAGSNTSTTSCAAPSQGTQKARHPLEIDKVQVNDSEYLSEVPPHLRNKNFPGFPSCTLFVGMPGSGKSNTFMHMMLSEKFWRGFFDEIYLFGPTVKSDKLYERIKVPDKNICADPKEMLAKCEEILDKQQAAVEKDKKEAFKVLVVFEDLTSFFNKVQNKPEFQRWYTQFRHLKGTAVSMVHKYKAFNRTCRMCTQHILIYECNRTERVALYEDYGPPTMDIKQWFEMIDYALTKTPDCPKPFFYINMTQPYPIRFRKCFTEILEIVLNINFHRISSVK